MLRFLTDPRVTEADGEWAAAVRAWEDARIRKVVQAGAGRGLGAGRRAAGYHAAQRHRGDPRLPARPGGRLAPRPGPAAGVGHRLRRPGAAR